MSNELSVKSEATPEAAHESTRPVRSFVPKVDIVETDEALWVWADIPGVQGDAIDVRLDNGKLSIEGAVRLDEYDDLSPLYTEYNVGNFERNFEVSPDIDGERIEARVANGVLELKLPKIERARARQIPIQAH